MFKENIWLLVFYHMLSVNGMHTQKNLIDIDNFV